MCGLACVMQLSVHLLLPLFEKAVLLKRLPLLGAQAWSLGLSVFCPANSCVQLIAAVAPLLVAYVMSAAPHDTTCCVRMHVHMMCAEMLPCINARFAAVFVMHHPPTPAVCASGWYGLTSHATRQASCNQCPGTRPVAAEGARSAGECKACQEGYKPNEIFSDCGGYCFVREMCSD